jgi:hypothetical protein
MSAPEGVFMGLSGTYTVNDLAKTLGHGDFDKSVVIEPAGKVEGKDFGEKLVKITLNLGRKSLPLEERFAEYREKGIILEKGVQKVECIMLGRK